MKLFFKIVIFLTKRMSVCFANLFPGKMSNVMESRD